MFGAKSGLSYIKICCRNHAIAADTIKFYELLGFKQIEIIGSETIVHLFNSSPPITLAISFASNSALESNYNPQNIYISYSNLTELCSKLVELKLHYDKIQSDVVLKDPMNNLLVFKEKKDLIVEEPKVEPIMVNGSASQPQAAIQTKPGRKIAFLTSGGDSQGMNAAIRAIVRVSLSKGCEPYAVFEGYQGLVDGGDKIRKFGWNDVSWILSQGGTVIRTARCQDFMKREGRLKAAKNLVERGIDCLIVIGGDGSLTGADLFRNEWKDLLDELVKSNQLSLKSVQDHGKLSIVGMVGSIDNDMVGTEITIGANSALHRIIEAVDCISSTAYSHQRAFIIEVMGRHCGWLALMAAIATGADWLFIPEAPRKPEEWQDAMCSWIEACRGQGKRTALVILSEGAVDTENNPIKSEQVKEVLERRLRMDARITTLGHVQRGGIPSVFDRILATLQGVQAVETVLTCDPEGPSIMIGMNENKVTCEPLMECVRKTKAVGLAMKAKEFTKVLGLRDADFVSSFEMLHSLNLGCNNGFAKCNKDVRFAIIHVGAPAGGMNAATRAIAHYCLFKQYQIFGIYNGFQGLIEGNIRPFSWLDVDSWCSIGGSQLGINRVLPTENLGLVAYQLQKYGIQGLVIVGGFEAFISLNILNESRSRYPAFCIPMICLPATISNNVPGTEFSIGSDTALNSIVQACDVIKQSASASTKRVFVVEVQGGNCGYLATLSGLAAGATYSYVPEEGITINDIQRDSTHLKERFADNSMLGRIIIRNENASKAYTTEMVASILEEEGGGEFDARCSVLGHLQQGGTPSPLDRIRGTRLAIFCINFLEKWRFGPRGSELLFDKESAAVIGIKGPRVICTPVEELKSESDFKLRRPMNQWWLRLRNLARLLAKYEEK